MLPHGYYRLIREILLLTRSDLKIRAKRRGHFFRNRQDALRFIYSEWFECLCYTVNLDPDAVRDSFLDRRHKNVKSK